MNCTESHHVKAAVYHIVELVIQDDLTELAESNYAKAIHAKNAETHRKLYELHAKQVIISRNKKNS